MLGMLDTQRDGIASEEVRRRWVDGAGLASVSGDGLAQGLFGFGGGFFGCTRNELVAVFSWARENLGERHQIRVFVESDFGGMNCGVGLDGHGRDLDGSAAAGAGEFERGFGRAGNFLNDIVAFWNVVSPTTNGRDIRKTICVVICALAASAPMISASSVESASLAASGFMISPCGLNVHARIFLKRRDVHSKNSLSGGRSRGARGGANCGAMLVAWERGTTRNGKTRNGTKRHGNGRGRACAPIACTRDELNRIAARNFICASWRKWIPRIENIRRCR